MLAAFILILHFILVIYVFFINKKDGIGEAFLAVGLIIIIFAVGWTISTMITNLIFSITFFSEWYWQHLDSWLWLQIRKEFNRDTISLIMLTIGEAVIYYHFLPLKKENSDTKS